jgi:hypothetical protein
MEQLEIKMNYIRALDETDKEFAERIIPMKKYHDVMDILEIPQGHGTVHIKDLYDIFMDEEKFNKLVSKIRLKAFW